MSNFAQKCIELKINVSMLCLRGALIEQGATTMNAISIRRLLRGRRRFWRVCRGVASARFAHRIV